MKMEKNAKECGSGMWLSWGLVEGVKGRERGRHKTCFRWDARCDIWNSSSETLINRQQGLNGHRLV